MESKYYIDRIEFTSEENGVFTYSGYIWDAIKNKEVALYDELTREISPSKKYFVSLIG